MTQLSPEQRTVNKLVNKDFMLPVAKVLWTLCYASPEEIPELQRPRRATGNRRNLQCGDNSIMRAKATRDMGSPCLGAVGASVWGVGLTGCRFLCAGKYLALLIEHEWIGPQHPAQGSVTFPGILFMTWRAQGVMNGWLLVFLYRILCSSTTCGISGCSEEALHFTASCW